MRSLFIIRYTLKEVILIICVIFIFGQLSLNITVLQLSNYISNYDNIANLGIYQHKETGRMGKLFNIYSITTHMNR